MNRICALIFCVLLFTGEVFATPGKKQLTVRLRDVSSGLYDITHIYLDMGRSPLFNPTIPPPPQPEDAAKQFDTAMALPQLYSFTSDSVPCYSNGYGPFDSTTVVRLGVRVKGGSSYTFSAQLIDNFDPTSIVLIEDRTAGTFTDLRLSEYTVSLQQPQTTEDRFYIHISYPPIIDPTPSGCNDGDGSITITQDNFIVWNSCMLYDSNFAFITSYTNVSGNLSFADLDAGEYNVAFLYGSHAAIKEVTVKTHQIKTSASASTLFANVDQTIYFFSQATNATSYVWDFGDGTIIDGIANPQLSYPVAGVYTVTLHCSNAFGCDAYETMTITVGSGTSIKETNILPALIGVSNKSISVLLQAPDSRVNYEIYNPSGQLVSGGPVGNVNTVVDLSTQATGLYIVRLQGEQGSLVRKIFLE